MQTAATFFAHMAFSLMALCAILLIPNWRKNQSTILFSLLMLCGCGYLINESFGAHTRMSWSWWLEYVTSNALPGVFWLTCLSIFNERHQLYRWQYLVASMTVVIPLTSLLIQLAMNFDLRQLPAIYGLTTYGALTLELFLLSHALAVAAKNWQADLVETRRYMRASIVCILAVYIVLVIVVEQLLEIKWQWLALVKFAVLSALALMVHYLLFSLKQGTFFDFSAGVVRSAEKRKNLSPELQRVVDSMLEDKLYREDKMTISALSKRLSIHEYKLRQLINGELSYRNFNDFLNFYRIKEVADNLAKSEFQKIPILTLALESGFRSLSSFNKAFKDKMGVTPTEFRNQSLAIQVKPD